MKMLTRAFVFGLILQSSVCVEAIEVPEWIHFLKPEANLQLRWTERWEEGYGRSGLFLRARGGVFPQLESGLLLGAELSTYSSTNDTIALADGLKTKSIGLSQAFLGFEFPAFIETTFLAGKFISPTLSSTLIYGSELRPEGFFETAKITIPNTSLSIAIYGAQYSMDQIDGARFLGEDQHRSWVFQQGLQARWNLDAENYAQLAFNHYFFQDPSSRTANESALRGNSFSGTLDKSVELSEDYGPAEIVLRIDGKPLGLSAGADGAFALNLRSKDHQRGFNAGVHLGNPWKKRNFFLNLLYFYAEPDLTVASFTEDSLGYLNRKGTRLQLSYFPFDEARIGLSYLYASVISRSSLQSIRHEVRGEMEVKF